MGENKLPKKQIIPQMFDVRPTDKSGNLDLEKIKRIGGISGKIVKKKEIKKEKIDFFNSEKMLHFEDVRKPTAFDEEAKRFRAMMKEEKKILRKKKREIEIEADDSENIKNVSVEFSQFNDEDFWDSHVPENSNNGTRKIEKDFQSPTLDNKVVSKNFLWLGKFAFAGVCLVLIFASVQSVFKMKNGGMVKGESAIAEMVSAKDDIKNGNFDQSYIKFKNANEKLTQVSDDLGVLGGSLTNFTKYIPFLSKISSGSNIIKAGGNISEAGQLVAEVLKNIDELKNTNSNDKISYLELFQDNVEKLKRISVLLSSAQDSLDNVNLDDIPEENRNQFVQLKGQLPIANSLLGKFLSQEKVLVDILGGNGPRKYLFLFQNNQEMRATGGFVGTYGLLDIFNGQVRNFFIDGIYNPDGQLKEKIVPPTPIQKMSATWSLHDSNWFPDFPVSAEKAISFYEKTGGSTTDGVITMTPTVLQKLLKITGPIDMPEYGVTVDSNNFIEEIQREVEIDYDKELNQPKKILADLAPKILEKVFNSKDLNNFSKLADILLESLNEKQILVYSKNWEIEKMLSENGWSGEIINTPKDYLSVINTNINGFKTDGIIDETITHEANIQEDGTIIDTVTIVRKHNGGDTPFEWWNKVNADYLRVYVPKGSQLISVEGQTREFDSPPLDYNALGFKRDPQVQMEEDSMEIDRETGTRIYTDAGKTVFANWAYVSPKETVTIKYVYTLPFKVDLNSSSKSLSSAYSLLAQKQSGSLGSKFISKINYPDYYKISWQYPDDDSVTNKESSNGRKEIELESNLVTDRFIGLTFTKN